MKTPMKLITLLIVIVFVFTGCKAQNTTTASEDTNTNESETSEETAENNDASDNAETSDTAAAEEESPTTEKTVIRIGMMSSYDVIPYVMINELGLSDKYNIELKLEVFTSAKDRDAAFLAGELDGVLTDYIGVCIYQNANFDVKITGITDGDYVLVAGKNSGITDISNIGGRSIAISENTLIDYTLDQILAANAMESNAVEKEIVPRIPDRVELLRNDQIDLGLLPEPFASISLNDGAIYLGSANDIGLYPAISAFTNAFLDEKSEAVKNLYKAYNEAVEYINKTDITSYEDIVIKTVGYPEEMKGQITIEPFRTSVLPPREDVENAIKWASDKGLCSADLTYEQLTFDVYTE
ncbi:MAG: lipoprotein [Herbinix sp.]|jgi:NitT/TauT family transport system substrate-binding protein|nr:lipoprotein [Herbinix sp.]